MTNLNKAKQSIKNHNRGSTFILSAILLIIISGLGAAIMNITLTERKATRNYAAYLQAQANARLAVQYAKSCLDAQPRTSFPALGTCKIANLGTLPTITRRNQTEVWWTANTTTITNADVSGTVQYLIETVGYNSTTSTNTYKIYGRGVSGISEVIYHELYNFIGTGSGTILPADPAPNNIYGFRGCDGTTVRCAYGYCCSNKFNNYDNVVKYLCGPPGTDQYGVNYCTESTAQYVPPGYTCAQYFEPKGVTCSNAILPP